MDLHQIWETFLSRWRDTLGRIRMAVLLGKVRVASIILGAGMLSLTVVFCVAERALI
tara:strand:+ start:67 stop:237 length:171 start_codon:yes stop_codon:yes gene_type:complete